MPHRVVFCDDKAARQKAGGNQIGDFIWISAPKAGKERKSWSPIGDVAVYKGRLPAGETDRFPLLRRPHRLRRQLQRHEPAGAKRKTTFILSLPSKKKRACGAPERRPMESPGIWLLHGCGPHRRRRLGKTVKMEVKEGGGPAIKIKDSSLLCNPQPCSSAQAAEQAGMGVSGRGADARAARTAPPCSKRGPGVLAACVSIPCRYIPRSMKWSA